MAILVCCLCGMDLSVLGKGGLVGRFLWWASLHVVLCVCRSCFACWFGFW